MKQKVIAVLVVVVAFVGVAMLVWYTSNRYAEEKNVYTPSWEESEGIMTPTVNTGVPAQEGQSVQKTVGDVTTDKSQTVSADTSLDSIDKELGNTNIEDEDFSDL